MSREYIMSREYQSTPLSSPQPKSRVMKYADRLAPKAVAAAVERKLEPLRDAFPGYAVIVSRECTPRMHSCPANAFARFSHFRLCVGFARPRTPLRFSFARFLPRHGVWRRRALQ